MKKWVHHGIPIGWILLSMSISRPNTAMASKAQLNVALSTPVVLNHTPQTAFLKVGITGFNLVNPSSRTPVNAAIVIDRSGSMRGEKMDRAKDAAILAIDRLNPNDIVSVIAYSHEVSVIVPATKAGNKEEIYDAIRSLTPIGATALFAGVSKGAQQIRKFIADNRANRVILVSDGLANVGPRSPKKLGALGRSLAKEGISVTTIGLGEGYNEDVMVALAANSDGNHTFAEDASALATAFNYEFGDLLSVVAQNVRFKIQFNPGVKPIRILGRTGRIYARNVISNLSQLYAGQEKFLLVEVLISPQNTGSKIQIGTVDITYNNTVAHTTDVLSKNIYAAFSDNWNTVEEYRNDEVMVTSVELIAAEAQKHAITLRDRGQTREAINTLEQTAQFLDEAGNKYKSTRLKKQAEGNRSAKKNLSPSDWRRQRKKMVDDNFALDYQQAW